MLGAVAHSAKLHLGRTRRDTDNHTERRREEAASGVNHLDKAAHHLFASSKVGNHSITEWANSADVVVSLLIHHLCLRTDSNHFVGATVEGYHRRLVNNDLVVADDNGVGSAKVHRNVLYERKKSHLMNFEL